MATLSAGWWHEVSPYQARDRADLLLSNASGDPMTMAVCATVFDDFPDQASNHKYAERAAKLWMLVAVAAPENSWVRKRLAAHNAVR